MGKPRLVCVGASVRAVAESAARAGFEPVCFDLFADEDLRSVAGPATRLEAFDDRALKSITALPPSPLVYAGAMENRPDFVDALASRHRVWGVTGEALRRCRDPRVVQSVCESVGLPALEIREREPDGGEWIWKPYASAGGRDIDNPACGNAGFWQERAAGVAGSVQLIGSEGTAEVFGHAWHGTGREWPDLQTDRRRPEWVADIARLVVVLGLRGAIGVDVIVGADGRPRVLEINPRVTASFELTELMGGENFVHAVARVFDGGSRGRAVSPSPVVSAAYVGKRVVFAAEAVTIVSDLRNLASRLSNGRSAVADVPRVESLVEHGEPICTVITEAGSLEELETKLTDAERTVRKRVEPRTRAVR